MPRWVAPMLAVPGPLPRGREAERYGYEVKWDGVRAIAYVAGDVRVSGRRTVDMTRRYPELAELAGLLAGHTAVVDGEIVAFDSSGRPSFADLQRRMHVEDPVRRGLVRRVPVGFMVFDLLYLDGHTLYEQTYEDRRELLEGLGAHDTAIQTPPYFRGDGAELMAAAAEQGLEGVVAKRLDSPYRPGKRVGYWRKVKHLRTQEVVVAGWKPGRGRRAGGIGSLLLGVYDAHKRLRYAGHVGTGFTGQTREDLGRLLRPLERPTSPYADAVPRESARDAHWVEPFLVGEVAFTQWTEDGRLRKPSWRGLRDDKRPDEVVREP